MTPAAGPSSLSDLAVCSDQRERAIEMAPAAGPRLPLDGSPCYSRLVRRAHRRRPLRPTRLIIALMTLGLAALGLGALAFAVLGSGRAGADMPPESVGQVAQLPQPLHAHLVWVAYLILRAKPAKFSHSIS